MKRNLLLMLMSIVLIGLLAACSEESDGDAAEGSDDEGETSSRG